LLLQANGDSGDGIGTEIRRSCEGIVAHVSNQTLDILNGMRTPRSIRLQHERGEEDVRIDTTQRGQKLSIVTNLLVSQFVGCEALRASCLRQVGGRAGVTDFDIHHSGEAGTSDGDVRHNRIPCSRDTHLVFHLRVETNLVVDRVEKSLDFVVTNGDATTFLRRTDHAMMNIVGVGTTDAHERVRERTPQTHAHCRDEFHVGHRE
jgi:hypothetical protein